MKTKKKNRFLTFCFSMLPGAGEMYMGFMKTGVSLMTLFFLIIMLAMMMNQGILAALCVIVWFYSFFHANHLAGLKDEEFDQVKDEFLLGMGELPSAKAFVQKHNKWIAGGLIFVGVCFLWNSIINILYDVLPDQYHFITSGMQVVGDYAPSIVIGVVIVIVGIKLLSGKKMELANAQEEENGKADN